MFASGSGTNFQALIDAVKKGQIHARIRGLISNKSDSKALDRAQKHDIETQVLIPSEFRSDRQYEHALQDILSNWKTDLIVLAGYMIKIPASIIKEYQGRIINIHPSLLPKYGGKGYYGKRVHQAVIQNNETESGCTVHMVTEEYDQGPILAQKKVPVYDSDDPETLARRVLKQEHVLLPRVVEQLIKDLNSKPK